MPTTARLGITTSGKHVNHSKVYSLRRSRDPYGSRSFQTALRLPSPLEPINADSSRNAPYVLTKFWPSAPPLRRLPTAVCILAILVHQFIAFLDLWTIFATAHRH